MKWFLGLIGIGYGPVDDFAEGPAYLTPPMSSYRSKKSWPHRTIRGRGLVGRLR